MTRRSRLLPVAAVGALALSAAAWAGLRPPPALAQGRAWTTQVTLSDLRSISCADMSNCWAVGSNSTAPVVWHTANGGQTWDPQTVGNPIGYLQSVYCQSDALHCWAAGTAEAGTGAAGVIYATSDGGTTWSAKVTPTGDATRLNGIVCPGSGANVICIAVGNTGDGPSPTSGAVLLVHGGDLSLAQDVPVPALATVTGVACQDSSDCVATGLSSLDQKTGVFTGGLIATSDGGMSWSTPNIPPDVSGLSGVACPSSGSCTAVGYSAPSGGTPQAVVISGTVTATSWTSETHITGVDYLDGVACPDAADCLAVGYAGIGAKADAKLAWTTDGMSWSTQDASAGYLDGVACPAVGTCLTAGYQALGSGGSGDIDALTLGSSWHDNAHFGLGARAGLTGISCASQTACVAVGNTASGPVIMDTTDSGSQWLGGELPASPAGTIDHLDAVACPTTTKCIAVGYEVVVTVNGALAKMAISTSTTDGTTWTPFTVVPGASHLDAVTCPSAGSCLAAGTDLASPAGSGFTGVIEATADLGQTWTQVTVPATVGYLTGIGCAPASGTCAAVGGTAAGAPVLLTTTTGGGTWTNQALPRLPNMTYSDLTAAACPTTTACVAVGDQLASVPGQADQGQAVILSGTGTGLASWTLQSAPEGTGPLRSISCATALTCEAVGTTINPDIAQNDPAAPTTTAVSTNDGTTWAADTLPTNVPVLRAVSCVAGTSACWAAGTSAIVTAGS